MPKWSLNFPGNNNTLEKKVIFRQRAGRESRCPPDDRGLRLQGAGAELPVGLASVRPS